MQALTWCIIERFCTFIKRLVQDVLLNLDGFVDDVVLEELLRDGGLEQDGRVLGKSGYNKLSLFDHEGKTFFIQTRLVGGLVASY